MSIRKTTKLIKFMTLTGLSIILSTFAIVLSKKEEASYSVLLDYNTGITQTVRADVPPPSDSGSGTADSGTGSGTGDSGTGDSGSDSGSGSGGDDGCFIAGTKVLMGDKSFKNIEDIIVGDFVMTSQGARSVERCDKIFYSGDIYSYNQSEAFFFTPNHPFMTVESWKSVEPERSMREVPGIEVSQMKVDSVLIKSDNSRETVFSLERKYEKEIFVYNISVHEVHDYYANNYLVHNK